MAVPPSFNPPSMGTGQPQTSLPNMGSPFGQNNPSQQTNPFMGGNNNPNNASQSPFTGAGFNNPFGGEHGAAGNPFGGGGAGGGVKGLIDSNNKLIQALNKLTAIFEKMTQRMGGAGGGLAGGIGGAMGVGGAGGLNAADPLQQAQMRRLAAGGGLNDAQPGFGSGSLPQMQPHVDEYGNINNPAMGASYTHQEMRDTFGNHARAMQQHQEVARQMRAHGVGNRSLETLPIETLQNMSEAQMDAAYRAYSQGQDIYHQTQRNVLNGIPGLGTIRDFAGLNLPPGTTPGMKVANAGGMLARGGASAAGGAFNFGVNIGSAQDVTGMLSQIPYIGGLLAAPMNALQGRINQSSGLEALSRLVAQQGGIGQTGNLYRTHQSLIAGFQDLGLDPAAALNEALQMQEAAGRFDQVDPTSVMGNPLDTYVGLGFTGSTIGSFKRLDRQDKMIPFDAYKVFGYGLSMSLGDQGMMELQGAFEGLQNMVPGMGLRGNADVLMGQVGRNVAGGFIGTQAVLQTQRQVQGTAEMGAGLKGIFGGLAETLTMASFLGEYGDPMKALRAFEDIAANPAALKGRLIKQFGKSVTEMGYLSRMTSADYDNIGSAGLPEGALGQGAKGDIVLSREVIGSQIKRGTDLYDNQITNAKTLIQLNDKLEQALIDGIKIQEMTDLTNAMIELADIARGAAGNLIPLITWIVQKINSLGTSLPWPF